MTHRPLTISERYVDAIRGGCKTSTIRYGLVPVRLGNAELLCGKITLDVHITKITRIKFGDLTEADALADGFADLNALQTAVREHYGRNIHTQDDVTKIEFEYIGHQVVGADPAMRR